MERTYNLVNQLANASAVSNSSSHAQITVESKINAAYDKVYAKNANTSAKANSTDFIDPKPWPNPTPVPLAKANKGDTPEKKEPEAAPEAIAQKNATKNANVSKKANTTDFIDPKPFPNPTPVPLAKANKGDTPEKKEPEAAPEAMAQAKATSN